MTQAEVRARVKVLEMMEELRHLQANRERREARERRKVWAETVDAVRDGTRVDGMPTYVDVERVTPVSVEMASVSHYRRQDGRTEYTGVLARYGVERIMLSTNCGLVCTL